MIMPDMFDVIVIGSGFGGAVTACRLAEKGMKVLVLERGRRWETKDYPREPGDAWLYDANEPQKKNGWLDFRLFPNMTVVQGAGVGGGSLHYANVSLIPPPERFAQGWPPEITYQELLPYYETVGRMLNVQKIPETQLTARSQLMKEAAGKLGYGNRFERIDLAVTFDPDWNYSLPDPFNHKHSKNHLNAHGKEQGTCVHLGNCDVGCDVNARNTLDLNYIAVAEKHGAEVRPMHLARYLKPENGGYRVYFDRIKNGALIPGHEAARKVILAAGTLGSTEILLRCRDQYKTLPNLSQVLGYHWSSNGNFLTPAFHEHPKTSPTHGPTITCAIPFLDGAIDGERFTVEEGGLPPLLRNYLLALINLETKKVKISKFKMLLEALAKEIRNEDPLSNVMPWFANGVDAANGRLYLGRPWCAPWKKVLKLDWDVSRSEKLFNTIIKMHKQMAEATGGKAWVSPTWTVLKDLITPHPLGGCRMGVSPNDGVVNHRGEVFGHPNLYVTCGAIIPKAVGLNPSRTIAVLAERIANLMDR
jgi:cholesterol oxidase